MKFFTTTFKSGFVSYEDIVVYKGLRRSGTDWVIPTRDYKVTLESELTSKPEIINSEICEDGVTISRTKPYGGGHYFRAIIPAKTKFWIRDDLGVVIPEKLYVTSQEIKEGDMTDLSSLYLSYCLDLLTRDGWRVSWSPNIDPKNIRGIFVYDSQAVSLDIHENGFFRDSFPRLQGKIKSNLEALQDFSGKERTKYLREHHPDLEFLKDLPKDFYIPACGELMKFFENFILLNLTRKALGLDIIYHQMLWSSTPYDNSCLWNFRVDWGCWTVTKFLIKDTRAEFLPFIEI